MRPLKKRDIIQEVAIEMGLDDGVVEAVVNSFWQELSLSIRELRHINIIIPEIGDFRVVKSDLDSYLRRTEEKMTTYPKDGIVYNNLLRRAQQLKSLINIRDEEYGKRQKIREKRQVYEDIKNS